MRGIVKHVFLSLTQILVRHACISFLTCRALILGSKAEVACRLRARFARREQDIQNQMSAAYKLMCSPMAEDNREQCGILQAQLAAALAA